MIYDATEAAMLAGERVDDIPLLIAHLQQMGVPSLLDTHLNGFDRGARLSLGWLATLWLTHMLSQSDAKARSVQLWAAAHPETLRWCTGQEVLPGDVQDARLRDLLRLLSDDARWQAFEGALNRRLLERYQLDGAQVRVHHVEHNSWIIQPDGALQPSNGRGWRPGMLRVQVVQAEIEPYGLPLATWVSTARDSAGAAIELIERVQSYLPCAGVLYVGQELGTLQMRALVQAAGSVYLYHLPDTAGVLPPAPVIGGELEPLPVGDEAAGEPAPRGYEWREPLSASVYGHTVQWVERRLLVRSAEQARAAEEMLRQRLAQACAAVAALCERKRGKRRLRTLAALQRAVDDILELHEARGLLRLEYEERSVERMVRRYRGRPTTLRVEREILARAEVDEEAVAAAVRQLGWQVYITNMPQERLPLAVLPAPHTAASGFQRLSGRPLSLTPGAMQRDDHVIGLVRLLTIAQRALALLEVAVRQRLTDDAEVPASHERRLAPQHAGERLLDAFRDIVLVRGGSGAEAQITQLTPLQHRVLYLLALPPEVYRQSA